LLDMSTNPVDGEIDCSDSDADSNSDDESVCNSINESVAEGLSIQEYHEDVDINVHGLDTDEESSHTRGMYNS